MKKLVLILTYLLMMSMEVFSEEQTTSFFENPKDYYRNIRIQPTILFTNQAVWQVADTTTMAGSEPNDLVAATGEAGGYGGRTLQAVLADVNSGAEEISVVTIPPNCNGVKFRCIGVTDTNTITYQIYIGTVPLTDVNDNGVLTATANCSLAKIGQLAFTIGAQASDTTGYYYADTLTVTTVGISSATASWSTASPTGDYIAQAKIDLEGENVLVIVPTEVNCDAKLLIKGY